MSLTSVRLGDVVRKQLAFKLKSYAGMFSSLVILQLIAMLFSFGSIAMTGSTRGSLSVSIDYYSADMVIAFTILWIFIHALQLKTRENKDDDGAFITDPLSHNLSNIAFLGIGSVIGGVTALLSSYVLRVIHYFIPGSSPMLHTGLTDHVGEWLAGVAAAICYIFLFSALGYLIGTLIQLHKAYAIILPAVFIGVLVALAQSMDVHVLVMLKDFYFGEPSLLLALSKAIGTAAVLLAGAVMLSNRLEAK